MFIIVWNTAARVIGVIAVVAGVATRLILPEVGASEPMAMMAGLMVAAWTAVVADLLRRAVHAEPGWGRFVRPSLGAMIYHVPLWMPALVFAVVWSVHLYRAFGGN